MQTCLEKRGIDARDEALVRMDYQKDNEYSSTHEDAISNGCVLGKGTQHGGHSHYLPDCNKPTGVYDYSNFDTANGGGKYDIEGRNNIGGRNFNTKISMYGPDHQYSAALVDTTLNRNEGQYVVSGAYNRLSCLGH